MQTSVPESRGEDGYTILALLVTIAISMVLMAAAAPSWNYLMKDSNEQELLFRGQQIADAIQRFQKKNANALPPSLEVLVKGKYLRKEYKDPMTRSGKWRFVRPGEGVGAPPPVGIPGLPTTGQPTTTTTRPGAPSPPPTVGGQIGLIQGVASTSDEKALRIVNGRTKYNEWVFLPGQPMVVGRAPGPAPVNPFPGRSPSPGSTPPGRAPTGPSPAGPVPTGPPQ
jgi:type II secretory pathway pseudopilin PulG